MTPSTAGSSNSNDATPASDAASADKLAIQGGQPVRTAAWPERYLFGQEEKAAAVGLFDQAIASGAAFGYNGEHEKAYCQAFAQWLGGGYADAVNSGTASVYVALRALDLPSGSEVIVPPITDQGGVMPVAMLGLIPVPADASPGRLSVGVQQIEARITPRTSAILVAHIAGHPCDMPAIMDLASRHKLRVVEDCAQAHGATCQGKPLGSFGDTSAFSTMSGKHHATAAQGGVVFTKDENIYWRICQAADRGKPFGIDQPVGNVMAGLNLNSNELACAVGRVQLKKLPGMVARRQTFAKLVIDGVQSLRATQVNDQLPGTKSVYWFLPMSLDLSKLTVDKDGFTDALKAEGLPVMPNYWHCPVDHPWYKERQVLPASEFPWSQKGVDDKRWSTADLPNALATKDTHFAFVMHENCGKQEADDIVAALKKIEAAYLK